MFLIAVVGYCESVILLIQFNFESLRFKFSFFLVIVVFIIVDCAPLLADRSSPTTQKTDTLDKFGKIASEHLRVTAIKLMFGLVFFLTNHLLGVMMLIDHIRSKHFMRSKNN